MVPFLHDAEQSDEWQVFSNYQLSIWNRQSTSQSSIETVLPLPDEPLRRGSGWTFTEGSSKGLEKLKTWGEPE